ncbi:hypothetical protein Pla22_43240 [Rubripirellula amarantea]|uniref:Uncharacterized protein n=1 Tax=Rubripirellula amarantea TaxID=2527999 RepID=A0A5C5WH62_9BACT|nr:hypothetical protein [Rubripirellula amarantea]TWT49132.1 hypothetical protein Pla22_43240 [Rubripirellula amarantea]
MLYTQDSFVDLDSNVQPIELSVELTPSTAQCDLQEIRRCIALVELLNQVSTNSEPECVAARFSISEHRWNNLLNNALLSLDCLEAMVSSGRLADAQKIIPVAIRSLEALSVN